MTQAHGGTVEVDDSPHGGARFTVRLPPATAEDTQRLPDLDATSATAVGQPDAS